MVAAAATLIYYLKKFHAVTAITIALLSSFPMNLSFVDILSHNL